jgi:hypothetical protein
MLRYRGEATKQQCRKLHSQTIANARRPMMSSQAKIARKHASARGPDRRAVVKTVGMGLAD